MKTNISYKEALNRASEGLRRKLKFSVELIRKAEKIAMLYSEDGFYLAFSGGKDSQAVYHVAELAGVKFKAEYSVTTCDPPKLIKFIKTKYPSVSFKKPTESIYSRCLTHHSGMLATRAVRWCCADFKETSGGNMVSLTGVRKSESVRRSKRNEIEIGRHKFSGGAEEFDKYRRDSYKNRGKKYKNVDYANFKCIKGKDGLTIMPIIYWDESDVWEFLNNVMRVPHCVLYDQGIGRIGCILCPLTKTPTKIKEIGLYPHHKHKWIEVILKNLNEHEELKDLFLPKHLNTFDHAKVKKETFESFNGRYSDRDIEVAEAKFDYWISGVAYDKWFADTYKQQKLF